MNEQEAPIQVVEPAMPAQVEDAEGRPDLVLDPVKAEVMAYASKEQEELVVESKNVALDAIAHYYDDNYRGPGNYDAAGTHVKEVEKAQKARQRADHQASAAASVYDEVR